ncbi:hypothetical protein GCM10027346_12120 [Hymenobacter seoulensis]
MKNKTNLVYWGTGGEVVYRQIVFSIFTLLYHVEFNLNQIKIVIYTDNNSFFQKWLSGVDFDIEILHYEDEVKYKGEYNYLYRIKPCIIIDQLDKGANKVFFVDSDTFFMKSPIALFNIVNEEISVMNINEYDLIDAGDDELISWLHIRKAVRNKVFNIRGSEFNIPFSARMWNSGVIGINNNNKNLLEDAVLLIDQIYNNYPAFHSEQFAIGYLLSKCTRLLESEDYIYHYFFGNKKQIINHHLNKFFKSHRPGALHNNINDSWALVLKRDELLLPTPSLMDRLVLRINLIKTVAFKGHL